MNKIRKEKVLEMATSLGYEIEQNKAVIYLVKGDEKIFKKSFHSAYQFLYRLNKKKFY